MDRDMNSGKEALRDLEAEALPGAAQAVQNPVVAVPATDQAADLHIAIVPGVAVPKVLVVVLKATGLAVVPPKVITVALLKVIVARLKVTGHVADPQRVIAHAVVPQKLIAHAVVPLKVIAHAVVPLRVTAHAVAPL